MLYCKEDTKDSYTNHRQAFEVVEAVSVLGIFMVGGLIATMINFEVSWVWNIGEKAIDFQDMMNLIFPRLIPAGSSR